MRRLESVFCGILMALVLLWLATDASIFRSTSFLGVRKPSIQLTGIVAMGCMSLAMVLALRPRWPEAWLGGLDKMYRLHKWLGIAALIAAILHWAWAKAPKWGASLGLIERRAHGLRPAIADPVRAFFASLRGTAEHWGEWAFYAAVLLIALALAKSFPYRLFYKTHRLMAAAYLVLAFHAVVLVEFGYWSMPLGWVMALLIACGSWAAIIVLLRRVGARRQVDGRIAALHYYPGVKALETRVEAPHDWPGHRAGQFAFAMSDPSEGAHPYTIASGWNPENPNIVFIAKELGDHTRDLRGKLAVGKPVRIEGLTDALPSMTTARCRYGSAAASASRLSSPACSTWPFARRRPTGRWGSPSSCSTARPMPMTRRSRSWRPMPVPPTSACMS
jgi:Predicted ferric reductase